MSDWGHLEQDGDENEQAHGGESGQCAGQFADGRVSRIDLVSHDLEERDEDERAGRERLQDAGDDTQRRRRLADFRHRHTCTKKPARPTTATRYGTDTREHLMYSR